jgi:hypothetical protein
VSPEERLRILGPRTVAEIRRFVAAASPPPPELVEEMRRIFAPHVQRIARERAAAAAKQNRAA